MTMPGLHEAREKAMALFDLNCPTPLHGQRSTYELGVNTALAEAALLSATQTPDRKLEQAVREWQEAVKAHEALCCNCDGGPQGDGLSEIPHAPTCPAVDRDAVMEAEIARASAEAVLLALPLLADTRAATEGTSEAEAERERIIKLLLDRAEVDNNIVKPGLWFAAGWIRQNSPAASAPTRETGWQPIETAPKDGEVWFWTVQEYAPPAFATSNLGHIHIGKFGSWSSLEKATHWMLPNWPTPPRDETPQVSLAIAALRDESLSDLAARTAALSLLSPEPVTEADVVWAEGVLASIHESVKAEGETPQPESCVRHELAQITDTKVASTEPSEAHGLDADGQRERDSAHQKLDDFLKGRITKSILLERAEAAEACAEALARAVREWQEAVRNAGGMAAWSDAAAKERAATSALLALDVQEDRK